MTYLTQLTFIIYVLNTISVAALPLDHGSLPLTPRAHARQWIEKHQTGKKPKILEVKIIYERLYNAFEYACSHRLVDPMVECWHLHHEVETISKVKPKGDFQVLEEKLLHFTLWRVLQKASPNKITEALSLWYLQQKLFQKYNPTRRGVMPITADEILPIFKGAFIDALNISNIDDALEVWQQQQKFIIDAHVLTENKEYISSIDVHAAFSSILETEDESYRIIHVYELWQGFNKESPLRMLTAPIQYIGTFRKKYRTAKEQLQLPLWLDCTAEPSQTTSALSLSPPQQSWVDSPKNRRIPDWITEILKASQNSAE